MRSSVPSRGSRPTPVLPASLVVCALLLAAPALAAPLGVVLGPFGQKGTPADELRDAVELELVVREDLLLSDPGDVSDLVGGAPFEEVPPAEVGGALSMLKQDALVRAEARGRGGEVVVYIQRAGDGAIVYGRRVDVEIAKRDVQNELLDDLVPALLAVRRLQPLTPFELSQVEGDDDILSGGGGRRKGVVHEDDGGERAKPVVEEPRRVEPPEEKPRRTERRPRVDERPRRVLGDRPREDPFAGPPDAGEERPTLLRAALAATPVWYRYRACPPARSLGPFQCVAFEDEPPTEVLPGALPSPGLSLDLEVFPVPMAGVLVQAGLFRTAVKARLPGGGDLALSPPELDGAVGGVGGSALLAGALRLSGALGAVEYAVSGRGGYRLLFMAADRHFLEAAGERLEMTLLPSYTTHALSVGAGARFTLAERARVNLEVDLLPAALHLETPTTVGDGGLAFGAHAKAGVDVDVAFGLFVTGHAAFEAINAGTEGRGTRLTRALRTFQGGQVDFFQVGVGLGLGYRM